MSDLDLDEATLRSLQSRLRSGELTSQSLCAAYLERIEATDRDGPGLRSVIEVDPDALAHAGALDRERRAGHVRGPLHGIPVLLKDNLETADRTQTTAGSLALEGSQPERDAFLVSRLRSAGAIPLGKANLSEWANFRSSRSTSGWSARGGQCRNPYALDHSPIGSSSGPAAAVAANLCAAAIGTETDGSIVCPASACSVVGVKPTLGLVSRSGIVPVAHSQDTAGPITRSVEDAAIVLAALAGVDPSDAVTRACAGRAVHYPLDGATLRGARIGVPRRGLYGFDADADRLAERALDVMRAEGAEIHDPVELPHVHDLHAFELTVMLYEFKADVNAYLAGRPGAQVRDLEHLIEFNLRHREREMPWFGQELFERAAETGTLQDAVYRESLQQAKRLSGPEGIDAVLDAHRLDALVAPTTGPPCVIDPARGDAFAGSSSTPAAVSGYASLTVPAGYVGALPVGISFIGRAWSEAALFRLAHAYERASSVRRPPS